ncbi:MGMT family protein [Paenibacillus sp. MZ04-78.2]|uniref:MGMT family protein n=1 Tax=Paenibacillus sp. MZ04-78.2 TaxID=2962034 RepID=UPI0020B86F9E|nr:MGMT family protein [Paenibacillus sp. MZ04-78.2]MCP3774903.1 MGMT family protein [Paenibacillus sp. MZ04-78.2]
MSPFTQRVLEIIQEIPEGQVMTYGQIAGLAGSPRGARQVVRILHSSSGKYGLPWHRVVNARGEIAIRQEESRMLQMLYLRDEGVEVADNGQLDLDRWRFIPHGE